MNSSHEPFKIESLIENAKQELRADLLPKPETAKSELESSMRSLEQFLAPESTENGRRWLKVLDWDTLKKQLSEADPDVDTLVQLRYKLRQNHSGLELNPFTQVRDNLGRYIEALKYGKNREQSIQIFQQLLDRLPETFNQPIIGSDLKRQREIGFRLKYLSESNQSPSLVQRIRSQFSQPNVRVLLASEFVHRQYGRSVSEPNPVNEEILGTCINGQSCLMGNVTPVFVPNSQCATIMLCLQAQFSSDSTGLNRGVTILSHGTAPVAASETIQLSNQGLISQGNVAVSATLNTQILDIQHKLKIVEKIATKKANQQKQLANSIAESRLENRLSGKFHEQIQERLDEANTKLQHRDIPEFRRLGLQRPLRTSWTSADYLAVRWTLQEGSQIAAPSNCPLPVPHEGMVIQIHQTAINNVADPVLGGRLLKSAEFTDLVKQFTKDLPKALVDETNGEEWSISMQEFHPVEVSFDAGRIIFSIRATNFTRGDQVLNQLATIQAAYKFQLINNEIQLIRDGSVVVEFAGREQTGVRVVSLQTFLRNKFNTVFREQLLEKPLRPLDRLPAEFNHFNIASIDCDLGWMQIAIR